MAEWYDRNVDQLVDLAPTEELVRDSPLQGLWIAEISLHGVMGAVRHRS